MFTIGSVRYPGIKIHDTRVIRLCEVLLHGGTHVGGWTANQIHQAVLTTFHLSDKSYGLNQLRYDLRKLRGHGLIERDGSRYAYPTQPARSRLPPRRQGHQSNCRIAGSRLTAALPISMSKSFCQRIAR